MTPGQPHSYEGDDTSLMTMLAQQWQQCHCDKSNNCHYDNGEDACMLTATMPARQQATRAMTLMMMKMPLQQGQQRQLEDGNDVITTRATSPPQIKGGNAIVMSATMPA
jgi:hypothetical protein